MEEKDLIPQEIIENKIFLIRGKKIILDRDLAALYGVETRVLNQAVQRNIKRFPYKGGRCSIYSILISFSINPWSTIMKKGDVFH